MFKPNLEISSQVGKPFAVGITMILEDGTTLRITKDGRTIILHYQHADGKVETNADTSASSLFDFLHDLTV